MIDAEGTTQLELLIIGAFVLVIVIFALRKPTYFANKSNRHEKHYKPEKDEVLLRGFSEIKRNDPFFDFEFFAKQIARSFVKVHQTANAEQKKLRPLLSDGLFERIEILKKIQSACGYKFEVDDVTVMHVEAVSIRRFEPFDVIQLRIEAKASERAVNLSTGEEIPKTRQNVSFAEYWSLLRRKSALTSKSGGVFAGNCPNCLALLSVTDFGKCEYCLAIIGSGQYDWIVSEITQISAGDVRDRNIPGLDKMLAKDPAFNVQFLEDRAAVVFWHQRAAEVFGGDRYLSSLVYSQYFHASSSKRPRPNEKRNFYANAALGAVEVQRIECNQTGSDFDRVYIKVTWSGREENAAVPGYVPPLKHGSMQYTNNYIFGRKSEARTPVHQGLASFHCAACGAPESDAVGGVCKYCSVALNSGVTNWVLLAI